VTFIFNHKALKGGIRRGGFTKFFSRCSLRLLGDLCVSSFNIAKVLLDYSDFFDKDWDSPIIQKPSPKGGLSFKNEFQKNRLNNASSNQH